MTDGLVQVERRGAFWFARLNRPVKRNALNEPMINALLSLCDRVDADDEARALVLWGAGGSFCAGGDFDDFLALMASPAPSGRDPVAAHNRAFGTMLERVAAVSIPTIGVVQGFCAMGGGVGLLACALDRVIASDDAVFALPEASLGLAPAQIAPFIARRIGATRARWRLLSAARFDASAAQVDGSWTWLRPQPTSAWPCRLNLGCWRASSLQRCAPPSDSACAMSACRSDAALDAAAADFAVLLRGGAAQEGIAATRERRRPAWHVNVPDLPEFL